MQNLEFEPNPKINAVHGRNQMSAFATDLRKVVSQEIKPQLTVGDVRHVCVVRRTPISLLL